MYTAICTVSCNQTTRGPYANSEMYGPLLIEGGGGDFQIHKSYEAHPLSLLAVGNNIYW